MRAEPTAVYPPRASGNLLHSPPTPPPLLRGWVGTYQNDHKIRALRLEFSIVVNLSRFRGSIFST